VDADRHWNHIAGRVRGYAHYRAPPTRPGQRGLTKQAVDSRPSLPPGGPYHRRRGRQLFTERQAHLT